MTALTYGADDVVATLLISSLPEKNSKVLLYVWNASMVEKTLWRYSALYDGAGSSWLIEYFGVFTSSAR